MMFFPTGTDKKTRFTLKFTPKGDCPSLSFLLVWTKIDHESKQFLVLVQNKREHFSIIHTKRMRKMDRLNHFPVMIRQKTLLFVFLFLCIAQLSAFSVVNLSKSGDDSLWPALAVNSKGEIMVVWLEWSGDNYYRIFRNGQWSSVKNCGIANQRAWTNELAVDSQGVFHLSYADGYASSTRDVMYSFFTGSSWSNPEKTYHSAWNSAWNKMDIDSNNRIYILWHHCYVDKFDDPASDIVLMSKPKGGSWPSSYENISRSKSTPSICPATSVKNGNVYACWLEGENPRRLYFCEKTGGKWKTPIWLKGMSGYYSEMDVDGSGNVHIVSGSKSGNFYYTCRIGGTWKSVQMLSNGEAPRQHGDIKCKDNAVVATWVQGKDGKWAVYASAKMTGGNWTIPIKIGDANGGEYGNKHVQVAIDNTNTAHFIWHASGVGGKDDIFYEKFNMDIPKDATFIEVDNSYLNFQTNDSASNPSPQTFKVRASGAGSINYTLSKDKNWFDVTPTSGSSSGEWDTFTVNVNASGFNDGTYNGTITITDPSAYNSPTEVGISLTVGKAPEPPPPSSQIVVDRTNLGFSTEEGQNPPVQYFNLRVDGSGSVGYTNVTNMPWLSASPTKGTATSEWTTVSVSVNAQSLAPGTFKGRIDVFQTGTNKKTSVFVTLTVEKKNIPHIQVNRNHLYFWGYAHDSDPPSQTFKIKNSGAGKLNYKITANKSWLTFSRSQGTSTGEEDTITVYADSSSLGVYIHKANIQISAAEAGNSPQIINVDFDVVMPPEPYPPVHITLKRINHEGLILQEYKNKVDWKKNPQNNGLFNITNFRIFRKDKSKSGSSYVYIAEVAGNVLTFYDSSFPSAEERNKFIYAVASVDSSGKESHRGELLGMEEGVSPFLSRDNFQAEKNPQKKKRIR
jgi:hypothetical protein